MNEFTDPWGEVDPWTIRDHTDPPPLPDDWHLRLGPHDDAWSAHDESAADADRLRAASRAEPGVIRLGGIDGTAAGIVLDELEHAVRCQRALLADQYRLIRDVLADAETNPAPWAGPDPTMRPGFKDPRKRPHWLVRREWRRFAVRAATADVATRLRLSEHTVTARAAHAALLKQRTPTVWRMFLCGRVEEQAATTTAQLVASLPDDPTVWAEFDEQVSAVADAVPPTKFRVRARAIRERVHGESLETRHRRASEDRDVWIIPQPDGMATLSAFVPAAEAHAAYRRLDAMARHLRAQAGETRTLAQMRADAMSDLLIDGDTHPVVAESDADSAGETSRDRVVTAGIRRSRRAQVAITIPVMTLLGHDDAPATLDGYGPIPLDTARRLAGDASSWVRVLTHPVTGTVLDLDRKTYRVTKGLRRWLEAMHPTCIFPGCLRSSRDCDIDHLLEWTRGGPTSSTNLGPECESHHQIKTETRWRYIDSVTGAARWCSPTAKEHLSDPAPF